MTLEASYLDTPYKQNWKCYQAFKAFLSTLGFTIYPVEFDCISSKHPLVDIAAKMGSFYWAFEYKSRNDSVSRGVEQLRCYSEWFDYVVLVSERAFDHRSNENYWSLKDLGAGIWFYDPEQDNCVEWRYPEIQSPSPYDRSLVARRFAKLSRMRRHSARSHDRDQRLDSWVFES
jgi:hypothetical protein